MKLTIDALALEAKQATSTPPPLDPEFVPAFLWEKACQERAQASAEAIPVVLDILRPDGCGKRVRLLSLPETAENAEVNFFRIERLVKFLLWQTGGSRVRMEAPAAWVDRLGGQYAAEGARAFDSETIGVRVFGEPLRFESALLEGTPEPSFRMNEMGGHIRGNRIGFDLGGSDRKCAAVVDGEVVFSEEIAWSPYFESDPAYHIDGIRDSIARAAKHLPRVDGIGGSSAGIYVHNEPRIASLFRGLSHEDLDGQIKPFFKTLSAEWGSVPFEVANDGDVTALAGSMSRGEGEYLGIAMGTSMACGYVDDDERVSGILNELAFVPVDYRENGPVDEWSGDSGCGVQYFSQQAVARLARVAGLEIDHERPPAEVLVDVQGLASEGDERAVDIFRTIGVYLAHAIAQFSTHYKIKHVLLLGRVMSGVGGEVILEDALKVLDQQYPELRDRICLSVPDDRLRRHGQAIAAASLPTITQPTPLDQ